MRLHGIHHLTAITARAKENHAFYTQTLGLRLVKKTVNQDDVSAYHLFYADGAGSPGTDMTFFDWPAAREQRGHSAISRTGFRVANEASLLWWADWLPRHGVKPSEIVARDGRLVLDFEDQEGQRLSLVDDAGGLDAAVWAKSTIPAEHQIRGLGPITLSVPSLDNIHQVLTKLMAMDAVREYQQPDGVSVHVYQMPQIGAAGELHVSVQPDLPRARQGAGGAHHVAFRIPDRDYDEWVERLSQAGVKNSGPVDRFYFRSLYFREPNGILFEIATDGPGFAADEPASQMGEKLALPPFLEKRRQEIEAGLKPLD